MIKQTDAQRIAALERKMADQKRELDALKAAQAPPPPFTPEPYQRYDPTAGMSMPRSVMREMTSVQYNPRDDVGALSAAAAPRSAFTREDLDRGRGRGYPANVPGSGTGWAREIPLRPSHHQRYVDAQLDAQDAKDRVELAERLAKSQR